MDDDGSRSPRRTSSRDDDHGHSDSETQFFDSQSRSPKIHGSEVETEEVNESSHSAGPIHDTVVFEEAFETQVVDLECETQIMDFGLETQVVDVGGETQVLDDVIDHIETQVLDLVENEKVCDIEDCEVSDSTEVLSDFDDLERKGSMERPETLGHEENYSGSVPKRFTSVRSASLRASGLAAGNTALKGSESLPYSVRNVGDSNEISRQNLGEDEERITTTNDPSNRTGHRGGNLASRRLFYGGEEEEELPHDTVGDLTNIARLSYVGSQEPGELSQANALDFVDRFLKQSIAELDPEIVSGKSSERKSRCLSSIEGAQKLAKKVNQKNRAEEIGIYDWDDSREDEGGGDILQKLSKDLSSGKIVHTKSASKLLSRKSQTDFSQNLVHEMNTESGNKILSDDVRFDTQMAAEAMGALLFGDPNEPSKDLKRASNKRRACPNEEDFGTKQSRKSRRIDKILNTTSLVSSERRSQRLREQNEINDVSANLQKVSQKRASKRGTTMLSGSFLLDKQPVLQRVIASAPVARRARRSGTLNDQRGKNVNADRSARGSKTSALKAVKSDLNKEFKKAAVSTDNNDIDTLNFPKRRRSARNLPRTSVKMGSGKKSPPCITASENEQKTKTFNSPFATPLKCQVPTSDVSPICRGDEYSKQSLETSKAKKSVLREIRQLRSIEPLPAISPAKDLRKRREITDIRVLYSNHLDENIIKHQKKILRRLGVSVASCVSEATHFVADQFVRTRNMLEAIAYGKPVVTHLWLECCGQSNCFIDEKHYILRDAKKEKEFGFSMPTSLALASQRSLLKGLRVLITPNTKPGIETISTLVKAVQGQAVERIGRSVLKDGAFPDDLLVISCEEDYEICVPFLVQGATIYSSELLLNGIVAQKLEYDRYRLFVDNVKKTRSSIWLKKDGNKFLQVPKNN